MAANVIGFDGASVKGSTRGGGGGYGDDGGSRGGSRGYGCDDYGGGGGGYVGGDTLDPCDFNFSKSAIPNFKSV
ncbi:hypothetical protein PHJA_000116000 [Phtheirospermum japonicum]|uniref:Uncharacterized protein n=1 Tax=Phtheirospermum japonicum TaxID=374723 RepID=A0A830B6J9_9LAMI|nr:hypothetical protein PHJA_000116000 [Phtheirospermum japonicum]